MIDPPPFCGGRCPRLISIVMSQRKASMAKIKVRRHGKQRIYIHNDLSNAAFYFKERIESRLKNKDEQGIAFDHMAFLVISAFAFEARINFIGKKLVPDWKERSAFHKKVSTILSKVGITQKLNQRPFSTLNTIKDLRDTLAHGKPDEKSIDEEVTIEQNASWERMTLTAEWQQYCTLEFMRIVHEDLNTIWKMLLEKADIKVFETLTSSIGGLTLIKKLESEET